MFRTYRQASVVVICCVLAGTVAWAAMTAPQVSKRITSKINSKWCTSGLKVAVTPYSDAETAKGRFKSIAVNAQAVTISDVKLAPVKIEASDVTLDLDKLMTANQVVCKKRQSGLFSAKLTEANLNTALTYRKLPIQDLNAALGDGVIVFTGTYKLGLSTHLRLEGKLECKDHYRVNFVPTKASAGGIPLPAGPLKSVLARINPLLDMSKVPLSPRVDSIKISKGVLVMQGK